MIKYLHFDCESLNEMFIASWTDLFKPRQQTCYLGRPTSTPSNKIVCLLTISYMSAHVLLNLLNELGKRDKMRGLPSILSLFRNEFNKFKNTRARMLDSIYHMTLRLS